FEFRKLTWFLLEDLAPRDHVQFYPGGALSYSAWDFADRFGKIFDETIGWKSRAVECLHQQRMNYFVRRHIRTCNPLLPSSTGGCDVHGSIATSASATSRGKLPLRSFAASLSCGRISTALDNTLSIAADKHVSVSRSWAAASTCISMAIA